MKVSRAIPHQLIQKLRAYALFRRVEGLPLMTPREVQQLFPPESEWTVPDDQCRVKLSMLGLFHAIALSARYGPLECGVYLEVQTLARACGYTVELVRDAVWLFTPVIEEAPDPDPDDPPPGGVFMYPARQPGPDDVADAIPF